MTLGGLFMCDPGRVVLCAAWRALAGLNTFGRRPREVAGEEQRGSPAEYPAVRRRTKMNCECLVSLWSCDDPTN